MAQLGLKLPGRTRTQRLRHAVAALPILPSIGGEDKHPTGVPFRLCSPCHVAQFRQRVLDARQAETVARRFRKAVDLPAARRSGPAGLSQGVTCPPLLPLPAGISSIPADKHAATAQSEDPRTPQFAGLPSPTPPRPSQRGAVDAAPHHPHKPRWVEAPARPWLSGGAILESGLGGPPVAAVTPHTPNLVLADSPAGSRRGSVGRSLQTAHEPTLVNACPGGRTGPGSQGFASVPTSGGAPAGGGVPPPPSTPPSVATPFEQPGASGPASCSQAGPIETLRSRTARLFLGYVQTARSVKDLADLAPDAILSAVLAVTRQPEVYTKHLNGVKVTYARRLTPRKGTVTRSQNVGGPVPALVW